MDSPCVIDGHPVPYSLTIMAATLDEAQAMRQAQAWLDHAKLGMTALRAEQAGANWYVFYE